ncbi:MAG: methyltransferase domain-containing protein [Chloroflexi bacterium]|nr:methyltransferase domain-containing protein [Chloroflexota bacterium]
MRPPEEIARLVRDRSPLGATGTERVLRDFFVPSRALRFVCEAHAADRRAILDIGCGYGPHLVQFGAGSAGLDAVEQNVAFCRALGLEAHLANVEDGLPDLGRRFDGVFCSNLLEHLVAPHLFLLRLHGQLVDQGRVFIHVPTTPPLPILDRLIKRTIGHNGYLASEHINAYTPRTLQFTLERAGFVVEDLVFVGARGHWLLRWGEPLFRELGISVLAVARRDPAFAYPEKRVAAFAPRFVEGQADAAAVTAITECSAAGRPARG